jgi:putative chitinase
MCIATSVGKKGKNGKSDVKTIQMLLNLNLHRLIPLAPLAEDGGIGDKTIFAITEFQRRNLNTPNPDGKVDPIGKTLTALQSGMPDGFTKEKLAAIFINAKPELIEKFFNPLLVKMNDNGITTLLRKAHFLAQIGHESGELRFTEEIASGAAYEGRADLGNTETGDGVRFKGRGLIQLTGRANYQAYGDARGKDYVTPENYKLIATDADLAVDVACWFWNEHNLNDKADKDDLNGITKTINGGFNGLEDRKKKLKRAKFFLKIS